MNKTIRAAFTVALLSTAAAVAFAPAPAVAQAAAQAAAVPKMSSGVQKKLSDASALANQNKFAEALVLVNEAKAIENKNVTDDYQINKFVGYIAVKQDDFDTAEVAYDAMARSPALPAEEKPGVLNAAASMALNAQHYDRVIEYVKMAEAAGLNDDKLLKAAAQSYYLKDDNVNAEAYAKKSIAVSEAAGATPDKTALEVLAGAQLNQSNDAGARETMERIALTFGQKEDWSVAISQAIGTPGMNDLNVVFLSRLMQAVGGKTQPPDYKLFGDSANRIGFLGDAVTALDNGAEGLPANLRANATKDENGLAAAEAEAAKQKDGNLDIANAESFYGYGNYAKAEAAARAGIAKGGLKDANEAQMVLGQSLVAQGHYSDAIPAFKSVQSSNAAVSKVAYLWAGFAQQKLNAINAANAPAPAGQ